jgi:hypothetical protein
MGEFRQSGRRGAETLAQTGSGRRADKLAGDLEISWKFQPKRGTSRPSAFARASFDDGSPKYLTVRQLFERFPLGALPDDAPRCRHRVAGQRHPSPRSSIQSAPVSLPALRGWAATPPVSWVSNTAERQIPGTAQGGRTRCNANGARRPAKQCNQQGIKSWRSESDPTSARNPEGHPPSERAAWTTTLV